MTNKAIIFDCDGVLVNSEVIAIDTERKLLAEHGLHYEVVAFTSRFTGLSDEDFFKELDRDFAAIGKSGLPADFQENLYREKWRRFETELDAVDGIEDFLKTSTGERGVASSSPLERLHEKLHMTGLHRHFGDHIYSAEHVQKGKPAPDLFLFAAAKMERAPKDCLIIEDSVNGVRAGRAAGMTVWGFTGGGHADPELRDRLFDAGAHDVFSTFSAMSNAIF